LRNLNPGSSSSGSTFLIVHATVVAVDNWRVWLSDGSGTAEVEAYYVQPSPHVGDDVTIGIRGRSGTHLNPSTGWAVSAHGRRVAVHELGAGNVDWTLHRARLTHLYGEITAVSNSSCGSGQRCFVVEHQGTQDRIRVP